MKKLSLEKTWTECLRMWKWIAKEVRAGNELSIVALKQQWSEEHNYVDVELDCFFCDYDEEYKGGCDSCPGRIVDPLFHCRNIEYDFINKPIAFYNKLVALNKKRKKCKT